VATHFMYFLTQAEYEQFEDKADTANNMKNARLGKIVFGTLSTLFAATTFIAFRNLFKFV